MAINQESSTLPENIAPAAANNIVVLSDIHIGTNTPTNWYQKDFHEPYLGAILDWVIAKAASIDQLVLLGDIVDFWTCPPHLHPPTFSQIVAANPNILGKNAKLAAVINALKGRVFYVNGNHDMNLTQQDWDQLKTAQGYKVTALGNFYPDKKIFFAHGHWGTMFNSTETRWRYGKCVPVGHFVTRAIQYGLEHKLKPGQTAADLPDDGNPKFSPTSLKPGPAIVGMLLDYICNVTGMPQDLPITLPDGSMMTIAQAKAVYGNLWTDWATYWNSNNEPGQLYAEKAALADFDGTYMGWWAQLMGMLPMGNGAELTVFGHTHVPKLGLTNALLQYVNSGFLCPAKPDIGKQPPTFAVINGQTKQAQTWQVVNQGGAYQIRTLNAPADVVTPLMDYSCYVILDSSHGQSTWSSPQYNANQGYYNIVSKVKLLPGTVTRLWLQDYPGAHGTEGSVTYTNQPGQKLKLNFECPTGIFSNSCSGADFYTKSDGGNWGALNQVAKRGHPFFVRFVLK